jgi:hypothetical protein
MIVVYEYDGFFRSYRENRLRKFFYWELFAMAQRRVPASRVRQHRISSRQPSIVIATSTRPE